MNEMTEKIDNAPEPSEEVDAPGVDVPSEVSDHRGTPRPEVLIAPTAVRRRIYDGWISDDYRIGSASATFFLPAGDGSAPFVSIDLPRHSIRGAVAHGFPPADRNAFVSIRFEGAPVARDEGEVRTQATAFLSVEQAVAFHASLTEALFGKTGVAVSEQDAEERGPF